jgi:HK97 gp10 family phage protein
MAREAFRVEGLAGVMKTLKELPPELVSKRGGPVRSALRKASKLLVDEAKANVERIVLMPNADGLPSDSTGLLRKNIVTVRDNKMQAKGERYVVKVRRKRYPDQKGKPVNTRQVGALLEYGTEKRQPMPWLRPAFESRKHQVPQFFSDEINKQLDKIVKKLAQQNGVA